MRLFAVIAAVALVLAVLDRDSSAQAASPTFNRDIRPILADNCFACHGPDKNARKAKLRLDRADDAYADRDGKRPVVPGKPEESEMVKRITSTDPEEMMPPPKTGKKLSIQQINLLKEWIAAGGKYELHWAYISPRRPAVPQVKNGAWPINPIDNFVLGRIEQESLSPSPEADRRTLIRRLSFDLTGLPPKPEDVKKFVNSRDPKAWEKLVRDLLASRHYGERMAVPWLDLVRYADTVGYHGDMNYSVWPFRDYAINAFNNNMRFDQFTREQLAGDLLPDATAQQKVASGYNRLNRISTEGGVQDKEYLAKYASDRVRTTSVVWMGSTLGCAECHDHKFDPFSTKDFYQLESFFADLKEKGFYSDGFSKNDWGPKISLPNEQQARRLKQIDDQIAALTNKIASFKDEQLERGRQRWEDEVRAQDNAGELRWTNQVPAGLYSSGGSTLSVQSNETILVTGKVSDDDDYTITLPANLPRITAVRLEVLKDEGLTGNEFARAGDTFVLGEIEVSVADDRRKQTRPVKLIAASADFSIEGFPVGAAIDGNPATGWSQGNGEPKNRQAAFVFAEPIKGAPGLSLLVTLKHSSPYPRQLPAKFRLSLTGVKSPNYERLCLPADVVTVAQKATSERTPKQQSLLLKYYRTVAPELRGPVSELAHLQTERSLLAGQIPTMLVAQAAKPRSIRVLPRGDWMNDSGEVVQPGTPHFLRQTEVGTNRLTRLDLANWLVAKDNPLTARVFVNRLWKMYFGTGICRTLDDFGVQGDWPIHLELLDWLATEFVDSGWDVKHIVELIVSSRTYRQSSLSSPPLNERDPLNRLFARQSRFRLDAEMVRDNALAISGLLVDKQGGPSVRPYQPEGYYAPLNFPKREYVPDRGEGLYRRGVYTHWQRTFLHPSLLAFDASSREECAANRVNSNTPLQALVLLNDVTYVEAARAFGENIVRRGGRTFEARLNWACEQALSRPVGAEELHLLRVYYQSQVGYYRQHPDKARELMSTGAAPSPKYDPEMAAWTSVARALLNLNETITRS